MSTLVPAIDGWFTLGAAPALIGRRCRACGTYHFPPTASWCANPACDGDRLEPVELSRRGRVWSYTDARYQPPPPYQPPGGEHHPFAIVAVELERERLVVAGSTMARALGWNGARVATCYAACASGSAAIEAARTRILAGLCDVALVVGADTTPKGFLAPNSGDRWDDPDWLRFKLIGATNPTYFGLYARRRMDRFGASTHDFAQVKVKNARHGLANPNARFRKAVSEAEVTASPVVADPLHLLDICATSDGAAALVLASPAAARRHTSRPVRVRAVSTVAPRFPNVDLDLPDIATDSAAAVPPPSVGYRRSIAAAAYEEAGLGPEDLSLAEVYDLSTALELDWYEDIGLCEPGSAEKLLSDGATSLGGRIPVNVSGGLACFGEAVPTQAIAQVCEVVWQLRGQATDRQVEGANVGLTINQGLFGHGSCVVLST